MRIEYYVGIDNGVSGGTAILTLDSTLLNMWLMPIQTHRGKSEVDVVALRGTLEQFGITRDNSMLVVEEPGGSKSAQAARSMSGSFHALRAMCELGGFRWERVTPQRWQKPMLRCGAGETKTAALLKARSLWPQQTWLPSARCRVPHDALIDAALIAEYARREKL